MHKIRTFLRRLLLVHDRSDQPTGILPLGRLRSAVVLRDTENSNALDAEIRRYFARKGMTVRIMSIYAPKLRSKEELFVSLVLNYDVNEQYAAVASQAKFKVGSHPIKGNVYDLVVTPARKADVSQEYVFRAIVEMLEKIR